MTCPTRSSGANRSPRSPTSGVHRLGAFQPFVQETVRAVAQGLPGHGPVCRALDLQKGAATQPLSLHSNRVAKFCTYSARNFPWAAPVAAPEERQHGVLHRRAHAYQFLDRRQSAERHIGFRVAPSCTSTRRPALCCSAASRSSAVIARNESLCSSMRASGSTALAS